MLLALKTLSSVCRREIVFSMRYKFYGPKSVNIYYQRPTLQLRQTLGFYENRTTKVFKCQFHTTSRRDIPPVFALLIRPLSRIGAFLFGRLFKRWWSRRTPEEKAQYIKWITARRQKIYGNFIVLLTRGKKYIYI